MKRKSVVSYWLACTASLILGCGGSSSTTPAPSAPPNSPMMEASKKADALEGEYVMNQNADGNAPHTDIPLELKFEGTHVIGKFNADQGTIDGELKGQVVTGSWKEEGGDGTFEWVFSPDGKTFRGTFAGMLHSKPVPKGATWSGVRKK